MIAEILVIVIALGVWVMMLRSPVPTNVEVEKRLKEYKAPQILKRK